MPQTPAERRDAIKQELMVHRFLSVGDLAVRLAASEATIRRDLVALEKDGAIERTHGGATVPNVRTADQMFAARENLDPAEKRAIARATLEFIEPGHTLFLNDGSTTMALARELAASPHELFVATPGVNIAIALAERTQITVCLIGGFVRPASQGTSGAFAEEMVSRIHADLALISPDGVSAERGLSFSNAGDATLADRMVGNADQTVVLATGRKFGRDDRIIATPVDTVDTVITSRVSGAARKTLETLGVSIRLAESDGDEG